MEREDSTSLIINSMLIAAILCINTFSKALSLLITIPYNIVIMETGILVIIIALNDRRLILSHTLSIVLIIVGVVMGFSLILYVGDSRVIERLLKFIMYALFPMFCIQYEYDEKILMWSIFVIGFIHMLYLFGYAVPQIDLELMSLDNTMDLSYTSLIYMFAGVRILGKKRTNIVLRLIALGVTVLFGYFLVSISTNRGALLALTCYLALMPIMRIERQAFRISLFLLVLIGAVIVYQNIIPLLETVDQLASANGMIIKPLQKTLWQIKQGDSMTSGREVQYQAAFTLIQQMLGLPNGAGAFQILTNSEHYYPHNIFLEACIDMGIPGVILIAYVIWRAIKEILQKRMQCYQMILFFFCLSIPRLMISSSYWENCYIWPMIILVWGDGTMNAWIDDDTPRIRR